MTNLDRNDVIDHGVRVRVLPGPRYDDAGRPTDVNRNHGVGRITWYRKMVDPNETIFGVAMDDGIGTSVAKLGDVVLVPEEAS